MDEAIVEEDDLVTATATQRVPEMTDQSISTTESTSLKRLVNQEESRMGHFELLTKPNQPKNFKFPSRVFGNQKLNRSFQPSWFESYKWLHYDVASDSAFCFTCIKAIQHNMISSTKGETAFTKTGFRCWKKAISKNSGFLKHEASDFHKEAVDRWNKIPASVKGDIGEQISSQHAMEKFNSRQILLKILRNVRYLGMEYYLLLY